MCVNGIVTVKHFGSLMKVEKALVNRGGRYWEFGYRSNTKYLQVDFFLEVFKIHIFLLIKCIIKHRTEIHGK